MAWPIFHLVGCITLYKGKILHKTQMELFNGAWLQWRRKLKHCACLDPHLRMWCHEAFFFLGLENFQIRMK